MKQKMKQKMKPVFETNTVLMSEYCEMSNETVQNLLTHIWETFRDPEYLTFYENFLKQLITEMPTEVTLHHYTIFELDDQYSDQLLLSIDAPDKDAILDDLTDLITLVNSNNISGFNIQPIAGSFIQLTINY